MDATDAAAASKKRKVDETEGAITGDANGVVEQPQPELERDDISKILEPLKREMMLELLRNACLNHRDVLHQAIRFADRDANNRKVFVRGIHWETTGETLKSIFSQYGDLEDATVVKDKVTNKSKGYAFVTFRHADGAARAVKEPEKRIEGRTTNCQFAYLGSSKTKDEQNSEDVSLRKIYVGGVPSGTSPQKLLKIFSRFGEIVEGPIGIDKQTGHLKGYALFVYKTSEGARKAIAEPRWVEGHQVQCKIASDGMKKSEIELPNRPPILSQGPHMPPVMSQGPGPFNGVKAPAGPGIGPFVPAPRFPPVLGGQPPAGYQPPLFGNPGPAPGPGPAYGMPPFSNGPLGPRPMQPVGMRGNFNN